MLSDAIGIELFQRVIDQEWRCIVRVLTQEQSIGFVATQVAMPCIDLWIDIASILNWNFVGVFSISCASLRLWLAANQTMVFDWCFTFPTTKNPDRMDVLSRLLLCSAVWRRYMVRRSIIWTTRLWLVIGVTVKPEFILYHTNKKHSSRI